MWIDHVAVAVPDLDRAERELVAPRRGHLAKWDPRDHGPFVARQYRFRGPGRLELLAPRPGTGASFLTAFLARHGPGVHHVTVMVDDFDAALAHLAEHGLDTVDVDRSEPLWHEAFLRPSQVGGLVVQVVREPHPDAPARAAGTYRPPTYDHAAADLVGVALDHPDMEVAARIWRALGATIERTEEGHTCRWDGTDLQVRLRRGPVAGPTHLLFAGGGHESASPEGPAVVDVEPSNR